MKNNKKLKNDDLNEVNGGVKEQSLNKIAPVFIENNGFDGDKKDNQACSDDNDPWIHIKNI